MGTKADLVMDQGATFKAIINVVDASSDPLALIGYTASSQMKRWYTSLNHVDFTSSINATAGTITLSLTAAQTANIAHGKYVYDVDVTDASNNVTRIVEGVVTVRPGVTNISIETTANTYNPNTDFQPIPLNG